MNSDHTSLRNALFTTGAGPAAESADRTAQAALSDLAVSVKGLTKRYKASGKTGEKRALKSADLDIPFLQLTRGAHDSSGPNSDSDAAA